MAPSCAFICVTIFIVALAFHTQSSWVTSQRLHAVDSQAPSKVTLVVNRLNTPQHVERLVQRVPRRRQVYVPLAQNTALVTTEVHTFSSEDNSRSQFSGTIFLGCAAVVPFFVFFLAKMRRFGSNGRWRRRPEELHLELQPLQAVASPTTKGTSARAVASLSRPTRLPVWPVLNGLVLTVLDFVGLRGLAGKLEDQLGGRVAPMMLEAEKADPFILLVHHRHRFDFWDPIRPLFRLLLPEGFPAHPHRGFETVTITIKGGLSHRDSFGTKQIYGDGDVQWLTAGRGMLHEEMWAPDDEGNAELYQLWVNLPSSCKMLAPKVQVLGKGPSATVAIPEVISDGAHVRVISGEYDSVKSPAEVHSPLVILRVTLQPGAQWTMPLPQSYTCLLYVRLGEVHVGQEGAGTVAPQYHMAWLQNGAAAGDCVALQNMNDSVADVLLLAGEPLREPIAASGTWVMNSPVELREANRDYQMGKMGVPWPHTMTDEEWQVWVKERGIKL